MHIFPHFICDNCVKSAIPPGNAPFAGLLSSTQRRPQAHGLPPQAGLSGPAQGADRAPKALWYITVLRTQIYRDAPVEKAGLERPKARTYVSKRIRSNAPFYEQLGDWNPLRGRPPPIPACLWVGIANKRTHGPCSPCAPLWIVFAFVILLVADVPCGPGRSARCEARKDGVDESYQSHVADFCF